MKLFKYPFYKLVRYILNSDYFREQLWLSARDLFCQNKQPHINQLPLHDIPVKYRYESKDAIIPTDKITPVFITARFRSGSTFLWNIFRNIEGVTSYYEPFNENRRFLCTTKDSSIDPTHRGIEDYSKEYFGLDKLAKWYREEWTYRYLYMDEKHYDPDMYNYINVLIKHASGVPVLQFNRVDFRLPWLRANFPNAKIVHLYRHPREQWMSIQRDGGLVPVNIRLSNSTHFPLFYTIQWAKDLCHIFPFLEVEGQHPYAIHYYLWRLSYSFGKCHADHSVAYEDLVIDFEKTLGNLLSFLKIKNVDVTKLSKLNSGVIKTNWKEYASDSWYKTIETECDRILSTFFSNSNRL